MGGGLLQLVAHGAQDAYLSGNPQITFWKGLFKRHTNFAMEPFRLNLTGQPGWGVKQSVTLGRHADLAYSTYLEVALVAGALTYNGDKYRLGYNLLKYAELEIGGQQIDRLYSEWMFLWDSLSSDVSKGIKSFRMTSGQDGTAAASELVTVPSPAGCAVGQAGRTSAPAVLYVPLSFFYTRNPGCALPLIALQYHEVKINLLWNSVQFVSGDFTSGLVPNPASASVYVDYIYLDVEERRRMAQESHEYLIEQVQFNEDKGISSANVRIDLTFNHPVKELVWVVQPTSYTQCAQAVAYPGTTRLKPFTYDWEAVAEQWIQFNGQDRLDRRYGSYYNVVQPYQHHTGSSGVTHMASETVTRTNQPGVYSYSFALKPEEHQPSGTCNFSRLDTATLVMNLNGGIAINDSDITQVTQKTSNSAPSGSATLWRDPTWNVRVYAVNYNILRVMSGMAGMAYSN
jgi:hypothetical protein